MAKLEQLKVFQFAKFQAFLSGLLGLLAGILYSVGGLIHDLITTGSVNHGTALAFMALVGMPVIFATVGFFVGMIEAVLYNLFAQRFDGIEQDFI